jgi:hypothetical protein
MSASHVFKYLRAMRDHSDEGFEIAYTFEDGYVTLSTSNKHVGLVICVDTEEHGFYGERFCTNCIKEIEEDFYNTFVALGTWREAADDLINILAQHFSLVEVRCGGGKRGWNVELQRPKLLAALGKIKYDTEMVVEYLPRGEADTFNHGSPDTWVYSTYEPSDEVAEALQTLDTALHECRREFIDEQATRIKAAFKGWKARMMYAYNPHTSLGRYYISMQYLQMM